jgi:hypothetical protein
MKPIAVVYDNLDDRRELYCLFARLSPAQRIAFLDWCCRQSAVPNSACRPGVSAAMRERAKLAQRDSSADEKLTIECLLDVYNLSIQYTLDLAYVARALEYVVRRPSVLRRGLLRGPDSIPLSKGTVKPAALTCNPILLSG